jgi:hypothetical protein
MCIFNLYQQGQDISEESRTGFFNQSAGNYLIVGDFNAHRPLWGNQDACSKGRELFNAMENSELGIMNSNQITYRSKQYNTETANDLAFTDYEFLSSYKWEVEKDSWGSNYYHINITLNRTADARIQHCATPCICTKKTDLDRVTMHRERSEDTRNIMEDQNLDVQTKYTTAVSLIMEGVLDSTPKHKTRRNQCAINTQVNKPWKSAMFWDKECKKLTTRRKAVLLKLQEFPLELRRYLNDS